MTLLGWSEDNQLSIRSDTISRSDVNDKDPYDIKEGETEEQWRARMGVEEIGQVVELLKACDLWELVEERVVTAKANVENWDERNPAGKAGAVKGEFELVQVGFVDISLSSRIALLTICIAEDYPISCKLPPSSSSRRQLRQSKST